MPRHYLDLTDARTLETPTLQLVARDLADVVAEHAIGVVHGPAGLGKSFAVAAAVERLDTSEQPRLAVITEVFAHSPTPRHAAATIAAAVTREAIRSSDTRFQLQEKALAELSRRPHLLIIDEAQRLTEHVMETLRFLYDDRHTRLALLLVGGDGCWSTLSRVPMLVSRVYRRRHLRRLPAAHVPELMSKYHPLYARADHALLADVDADVTHGNWRAWVAFTATALSVATRAGRDTLDDEIVDNTLLSLGHDEPDP